MRKLAICTVLLALAATCGGCTKETQQKAGKALNQTGQALESAAKDTAIATKGAIEGAADAVEKNRTASETEPAK